MVCAHAAAENCRLVIRRDLRVVELTIEPTSGCVCRVFGEDTVGRC